MATRINFIDIYSFYNDIDASVVETLMEDFNITCAIRSLAAVSFTDEMDEYGEKRIAVEEDKIENAKQIIAEAIKSGVISREGRFRI